MTRVAWETAISANPLYARTRHHPAVAELPAQVPVISFDDIYEQAESFEMVYATIVERLLVAARQENVVYAVPGDPYVAEATTHLLLAKSKPLGIAVRILAGVSFVEPTLAALAVDLLPGMAILDAQLLTGRYHPPFDTHLGILLTQVYDRQLASDVKLAMLNIYPPEFQVALVHAAGSSDQQVEWLPLAELDHSPQIALRTTAYIPPYQPQDSLTDLLNTIAHLRSPEGCPWDMEQTHLSLRKYLIEEAYEVLQAIDTEDADALREELGDLLLQVLLHSQIAVDDGEFTLADVAQTLNRKLIQRHPHVFGDVSAHSAEEALGSWEASKRAEKRKQGQADGVLDGVPLAQPALLLAQSYQHRVAKVGFDWEEIGGVVDKIHEELREIAETDAQNATALAGEVGDLLFAVVNYARWLKVDAETALRTTAARFRMRFERTHANIEKDGKQMENLSLVEKEAYWQVAKRELASDARHT
jgi:tetrapyrrole methylase family protein/MazG family protein